MEDRRRKVRTEKSEEGSKVQDGERESTARVIKCDAKETVHQTNLNDMQRGWLIQNKGINTGKSSRWQM